VTGKFIPCGFDPLVGKFGNVPGAVAHRHPERLLPRILYGIQDQGLVITVVKVGHRRDGYRN
jgi:hypothetical protein